MKEDYVFVHIPKTAGTSLFTIFKDILGQENVHQCRNNIEIDSKVANELSSYKLIGGHFWDYNQLHYFNTRYSIVFFRDPVDRFLSQYYYFRGVPDSIKEEAVLNAKMMNIDEYAQFYSKELVGLVSNRHTFHLIGQSDMVKSKKEIIQIAKNNINKIDFIGLSESFNESIDYMCNDFGWTHIKNIPKDNVTQERKQTKDLNNSTIQRILDINEIDMELYKLACKRYDNRKNKLVTKNTSVYKYLKNFFNIK